MSGKDSTNAIKRAKLELDSIVKLAQDNLLRESEEKINKMIEEAMDEVQKEEAEAAAEVPVEPINEMIKLETDDMKVVIDDDGSSKVEFKEPEAAAGAPAAEPVDAVTQEPVAAPAADTSVVDGASDDEEIEISSDDDEIHLAAEADANQEPNMDLNTPPAAPEAAPAPAPAPAAAPEAAPDDLAMQLADVINKMIAQATGGGDAGAGDGVDIVDDEVGAAAPAPSAPAAPAAPAMEAIELDEEDELIELELEEDEALVDEVKAMGQSHTLNRTAGPHTAPAVAVKNRTRTGAKVNESTDQDKAQHEAKLAELTKENNGLKGQISEFRTAFIELREQFNEVQDFQKKLSFAYRTVMNGVWTEKEKQRISERFESAKDAEEAEKIYKEIISETKITQDKGVIKSSAIPVVKPKKDPIYESAEVKRAKRLAGIDGPDADSLIG